MTPVTLAFGTEWRVVPFSKGSRHWKRPVFDVEIVSSVLNMQEAVRFIEEKSGLEIQCGHHLAIEAIKALNVEKTDPRKRSACSEKGNEARPSFEAL